MRWPIEVMVNPSWIGYLRSVQLHETRVDLRFWKVSTVTIQLALVKERNDSSHQQHFLFHFMI